MTRLTVETDNEWTKRKIKSALDVEIDILKKAVQKCKLKLDQFEKKYGKLDRDSFYGQIDDMELIEWEGEQESSLKLQEKLASLEEISFEYK